MFYKTLPESLEMEIRLMNAEVDSESIEMFFYGKSEFYEYPVLGFFIVDTDETIGENTICKVNNGGIVKIFKRSDKLVFGGLLNGCGLIGRRLKDIEDGKRFTVSIRTDFHPSVHGVLDYMYLTESK